MRERRFTTTSVLGFAAVVLGLIAWGSSLRALEPDEPNKEERSVSGSASGPCGGSATAKRPPLPEFTIIAGETPWRKFVEWFADISNLTFAGNSVPPGSVTIILPKGKTKATIPEIVNLVNESMRTMKPSERYILIRRQVSFTLIPADEKNEPGVRLLSRQEIVEAYSPGKEEKKEGGIVAPRSNIIAEALPDLGMIIVRGDNAADVEQINQLIQQLIDIAKRTEIVIDLVPLQYGDATSIVNTLNQLFSRVNFGRNSIAWQGSNVGVVSVPRFNSILVAVPRSRLADVIKLIRQLDAPPSP